ncbi:DeoR/GlpR family DNA-binding transcription regulator [Catenovulum adriaticum]|uniref:DeoR family transcriptional regulator n=1 Tax=Catenovulum adriaticum TaxID=2984846 RepID=A0ABY7AM34_9ALTE|nr:DeoR family transcriptional regulator [Catenovulum sp. TS8]WAJ70206.1 DeoR family transcriptional regulator [Catenovulum sp. TS8]
MSKRNTQQRRHTIHSLVNENGEMSVEALSERFETSVVTIRKDLAALEKSGLLLRRYGGAVPLPQEVITDAEKTVSPAKQSIALKAAECIREHNRILIDSGRTTASLIPHLNHKRGLIVMTNALDVANQLRELENEPTILMTGGTWDPHSESFQGQVAEQVLRSYDFDQLFIGADGIDLERGTTTFNELIGLSRVMAEQAREVIVMIESDKIGRRIPNLELNWNQITRIITDSDITAEAVKQIEKMGVVVNIANSPKQG